MQTATREPQPQAPWWDRPDSEPLAPVPDYWSSDDGGWGVVCEPLDNWSHPAPVHSGLVGGLWEDPPATLAGPKHGHIVAAFMLIFIILGLTMGIHFELNGPGGTLAEYFRDKEMEPNLAAVMANGPGPTVPAATTEPAPVEVVAAPQPEVTTPPATVLPSAPAPATAPQGSGGFTSGASPDAVPTTVPPVTETWTNERGLPPRMAPTPGGEVGSPSLVNGTEQP